MNDRLKKVSSGKKTNPRKIEGAKKLACLSPNSLHYPALVLEENAPAVYYYSCLPRYIAIKYSGSVKCLSSEHFTFYCIVGERSRGKKAFYEPQTVQLKILFLLVAEGTLEHFVPPC